MKHQEKRLTVLHQLGFESEPIALNELLSKLGEGFVERSVRRWLDEMVNEGLVQKHGRKRSTKYQVTQHTTRYTDGSSICFGSESTPVIQQIRRPFDLREPVTYDDDWFNAYQPNSTFYIPSELRLRLHKAGKRAEYGDPAGTYAHLIFNRLLIDLSYNSSRLEGNTYSLLDTERLVLGGASAEGKLDEEKIMILNHKEAICYLINAASKIKVNTQTICTLHYLLSDGLIEPHYAGKIRDHSVRIGGSTYIPFEDQKSLQIRLDRITEKAALIEDSYEQSFFLLIHISYLQAFTDVNKRTARLSANIPLIKYNLVPLSFNDVEKDDYTSAMIAIYEMQNTRPLLDLYVFSYMRTCVMYDSTVKTIGFDEIRVRYRQQRRALVRTIILRQLIGENMLNYISTEAAHYIPEKDRSAFMDDVVEDIQEIDESRIAGLGITPEQLTTWIRVRNTGYGKARLY